MDGQTAYEIMYKLKGSNTWLTAGKVNSTATSYDLRNIYNLLGIDFDEISYKVLLYYSATTGENETTSGTEYSNTYSLIFNQGISGYINIWNGSEKESYPIFDTINNDNIRKLHINTDNGTKLAPLVDANHPLSSNLKVRVSDTNTECVAASDASFTYYTPTSSDTFGDFRVTGGYSYYNKDRYSYVSSYSYKYYYVSSTPRDSYRNYLNSYYYYRYYTSNTMRFGRYYNYIPTYNVYAHYITSYYHYNITSSISYRYSGDYYYRNGPGFFDYKWGFSNYLYGYYTVGSGGAYGRNYNYYQTQASGTYRYDGEIEAAVGGAGNQYGGYTWSYKKYATLIAPYYYYSYSYYYYWGNYYYYGYNRSTYYYYSYTYYYYNAYSSRYTNDIYNYRYYYYYANSTYSYQYKS